ADAALAVLGADLPGDRVERTLELLRQADGK
ncbi:MAG: TetR/AcrR family transcriptional regulator, partial [Corynebacterium sp.]|nr:TetR/AcrR family transcriptional regulator [Corynebacterium sp.]